MLYTTWGSVRSDCGHVHKSFKAATQCIDHDHAACESVGGYSDRNIRVISSRDDLCNYDITSGPGRPLTADEYEDEYENEEA